MASLLATVGRRLCGQPRPGSDVHRDVALRESGGLSGQGVRPLVPGQPSVGGHPLQVERVAASSQLQEGPPNLGAQDGVLGLRAALEQS